MNKSIVIRTAIPLDRDYKVKVIACIEKKLKDIQFEYSFIVDSGLIGGIIIESDDFVLDGTIKAKLKVLGQNLED